MRRLIASFFFGFLSLAAVQPVFSQDIFEQYYGSGVHAYFAGKHELADELFNELIDAGSQDPRVYYFRGLNQIRLQGGCVIEAGLPDFEQAAQLELTGKQSTDVSKALTRIQGPTRIAIERIRMKARLAHKNLQADMQAAGMMPTDGSLPASPDTKKAGDPFANGQGMTGGEPAPMPPPSEPSPSDSLSPFNTESPVPGAPPPAPEPGAMNIDPFGAPEAKPSDASPF